VTASLDCSRLGLRIDSPPAPDFNIRFVSWRKASFYYASSEELYGRLCLLSPSGMLSCGMNPSVRLAHMSCKG